MKKFSLLLLITILISSCKNEAPPRDGYLITGKSPGIYNGIRAYLKAQGPKGREVAIDTAIVMDETFVFDGKLKNPDLVYLSIDNIKGKLPLVLANDEISISVDKADISKSSVTGATSTELYNSFNDGFVAKRKEIQQVSNEIRKAGYSKDTAAVKSLQGKLKSLNESASNYVYDFVDNNSDNVVALILLDQQSKQRNLDGEKFMKSYDKLSDNLKSSGKGRTLEASVNRIMDQLKKTENLKIGKPAPEFSAPNIDGKTVALNDIKGKVTIVDFWASWCGPCRRENPNVVKVYNKYHDKGLEIIGVSLDKKGQKDRWLKAIEKDKLTWHHVSNLNYFNDPVAKMYNINSIPATYILDEHGTIVAKNLRGPALEAKIAELLN